jgi:hypothetical protein
MSAKFASTLLVSVVLALSLGCGGFSGEAPAAEAPVIRPEPSPEAPQGRRARKGGRRSRGGGGGGGSEAPAEAPAGPSPAYRTFEADGGKYRIVFTSDGVRKTWSNMSGPAVTGQWRQAGDAVTVDYAPAEHHGSASETFLVRGECSLLRAERVDKDGRAFEDPKTYVLDEPQCR